MTSNSTLVEDLDAIELWVEDVDKFTKGIGTSKSMVDRILFRPATFPKKSTEVLGPAVARLLILPVVAAWRDAGRDPAALSKIKDDLVDTWGYGEACVKTYLDTACARAAQIRLSICAGWLLRTSELYSGDVNAKTVAVGIERAVRQVISAAGLTLIDVAKYNAFFAALKSSEERSHLQIYDDLSRLEATCEQIDVNVTAAMGTQRERLAVVDSQCNENSRTITTLDARVAKVATDNVRTTEELHAVKADLQSLSQRHEQSASTTAGSIRQLGERIDQLQSGVQEHQQVHATLSQSVDTFRQDCQSLRTSVTNSANETSSLRAQIAGLQKSFRSMRVVCFTAISVAVLLSLIELVRLFAVK